jgi:hypothetical protein
MMLRRFELYSFAGSQEELEGFADAARDCARFIPEVLHSAIGRFSAATPLNFAWEHAFDSPEAYSRYMDHPYHAARLDRYLMIDSPECIATDNRLGVGLIGYFCEQGEYYIERGARRVIAMRFADDSADVFARLAEAQRGCGGMLVSVFRPNELGRRWFDGKSVVDPNPMYSHVWEQGFPSLDAAYAYGEPWHESSWGAVEASMEVVYEIEPGCGYFAA